MNLISTIWFLVKVFIIIKVVEIIFGRWLGNFGILESCGNELSIRQQGGILGVFVIIVIVAIFSYVIGYSRAEDDTMEKINKFRKENK
jgi:uncharacterized membrane protein